MAAMMAAAGLAAAPTASQAVAGPEAGPPTAAPAYVVRGSIGSPTSLANGVRCPDALTNGATAYGVPAVTPGRVFSLMADDATYRNDFDIRFFTSAAACANGEAPLHHMNHAGDEHAVVPATATYAVVTLTTGTSASFVYSELPPNPFRRRRGAHGVTVVAVVEPFNDGGYDLYHDDFLGDHHPWNTDDDPSNDIDFSADPSTYIPGMPARTPLALHLPTNETDPVGPLFDDDADKFASMQTSTATEAHLYWFPGTKVVAAANFTSSKFAALNHTHATHTSSVAAGNIHGACPECVFVLLGGEDAAVAWAASQPWIDVITNSWIYAGGLHDAVPSGGGSSKELDAVEAGQVIVWGAGNGVVGTFLDAPNVVYAGAQRGRDWILAVGAVMARNDQPLRGSGRPADIAAYGTEYPAAGGGYNDPPNYEGIGQGTSNAAPVVAGTFAKVIQLGREMLDDNTPGHAGGVVAEGRPRACAASSTAPCPLADGKLERSEVRRLIFDNVLPSMQDATPDYAEQPIPGMTPTEQPAPPSGNGLYFLPATVPADFGPVAQGAGIVFGRLDGARWVAEQRRFSDALLGAVVPYRRPAGERAWQTAHSKCRQQIWGPWPGGDYQGSDPQVGQPEDGFGAAWAQACAALPSQTANVLSDIGNFQIK